MEGDEAMDTPGPGHLLRRDDGVAGRRTSDGRYGTETGVLEYVAGRSAGADDRVDLDTRDPSREARREGPRGPDLVPDSHELAMSTDVHGHLSVVAHRHEARERTETTEGVCVEDDVRDLGTEEGSHARTGMKLVVDPDRDRESGGHVRDHSRASWRVPEGVAEADNTEGVIVPSPLLPRYSDGTAVADRGATRVLPVELYVPIVSQANGGTDRKVGPWEKTYRRSREPRAESREPGAAP